MGRAARARGLCCKGTLFCFIYRTGFLKCSVQVLSSFFFETLGSALSFCADRSQLAKAKLMVIESLQHDHALSFVSDEDASALAAEAGRDDEPSVAFDFEAALKEVGPGKFLLTLPTPIVGRVIGKTGSRIKTIRSLTGATITVEHTSDAESRCIFTGTAQELAAAKVMLAAATQNEEVAGWTAATLEASLAASKKK